MTDNGKSGVALILGTIGGLVTMAIHPTSAGAATATQADHLALHSAIAHSLAMLSSLAMVLGVCGLTKRLNAPDRLAFSGMIAYLFGAVAILIATAVSGFIVPALMHRMSQDAPGAAGEWHIAIVSIFQINQAFAGIYTVAVSIAVALWSVSALKQGMRGRLLMLYGCVSAPLLVLGICIGMLRLNVPGMALVVVAQGIWFIGVGIQLRAEDEKISAQTATQP